MNLSEEIQDAYALKDRADKAVGVASDLMWRVYHAKISRLEKKLARLSADRIYELVAQIDSAGRKKCDVIKIVK